jgi:PDZ domain-containing protein
VQSNPTGALVEQVAGDAPAAGKLLPADVIVSAAGRKVRSPVELRNAIGRVRPGTNVRLVVRRGKGQTAVTVGTIADPKDPKRAIIGIFVAPAASIKLPLKVKIDAGNIGGPSAGLPFALDVLERLGKDVDHGRKIAATGEINLDGSVGPVGGIEQKTIGVRKSGIRVFLVPAGDNAAEARRYAHGVRIVPVHSFRQALRSLATLSKSAA